MAVEHVDPGWCFVDPRRTMSLWSWQPTLESACVARRVLKLHAAETSHWQSSGSVAANRRTQRSRTETFLHLPPEKIEKEITWNYDIHWSPMPRFSTAWISTAKTRMNRIERSKHFGWLQNVPGCCVVLSLAMAEKPTDEIPWFVSTPFTSIWAEISTERFWKIIKNDKKRITKERNGAKVVIRMKSNFVSILHRPAWILRESCYYIFPGKQIKLYQVEEPGECVDHDLSICEQRVLWCQCGESLVDASIQHPALPPAHLRLRYVRQAGAFFQLPWMTRSSTASGTK